MPTISRLLRGAILGLGLLASACSALVPPESCGPEAEVAVDEARFAQLFRSMELVSAATGLTGEPDEEGTPRFTPGEELQVVTDNLGALGIRACVQERRRAGTIAGEREGSLPAGRALIPLGSFEEGDYVVRVTVERVLVRNLPFSVVEMED
ncbi:MAG TPA: hypothetical protein VI410_01885 [Anaerolineales bacterium]|nr:hypothetical protein [Anaerolineales bacterium]